MKGCLTRIRKTKTTLTLACIKLWLTSPWFSDACPWQISWSRVALWFRNLQGKKNKKSHYWRKRDDTKWENMFWGGGGLRRHIWSFKLCTWTLADQSRGEKGTTPGVLKELTCFSKSSWKCHVWPPLIRERPRQRAREEGTGSHLWSRSSLMWTETTRSHSLRANSFNTICQGFDQTGQARVNKEHVFLAVFGQNAASPFFRST